MALKNLMARLKCRAADTFDTPGTPEVLQIGLIEALAANDQNAWRELAQAYHAHHFNCITCIAAGRGAVYGLRCGAGMALWTSYQNT